MLKKKFTFLTFVLIFIVSLIGCSEKSSQQEEYTDGAKGVFYQVSNEENTVYLLGSVHVGQPKMYPLHGKIVDAYTKSNHLAVEVNINDLNPVEMMQQISEIGMYSDGSMLSDHIDSELYAELVSTMNEHGMNETEVSLFKPWLVSDMLETTLLEQHGYSLSLGVDQYFLTKAEEDEKNIISLETIEDQLKLYSLLGPESQEKALYSTIFEADENKANIDDLIEKWIRGDTTALEELRAIGDDKPEDYIKYYKALTDERDKEMAKKIEEFLQNDTPDTYFIVVGSLHLVGENSIIDILDSKGYEIENAYANK